MSSSGPSPHRDSLTKLYCRYLILPSDVMHFQRACSGLYCPYLCRPLGGSVFPLLRLIYSLIHFRCFCVFNCCCSIRQLNNLNALESYAHSGTFQESKSEKKNNNLALCVTLQNENPLYMPSNTNRVAVQTAASAWRTTSASSQAAH